MAQLDNASSSSLILHATTIAVADRAALIQGASGQGKSSLALQLMALGAQLVADDRTCLERQGNQLIASAPDSIKGAIEARGIGILKADCVGPTPVHVLVDLDAEETDRLPDPAHERLLGLPVPVIKNSSMAHFPAAILLYLRGNRLE